MACHVASLYNHTTPPGPICESPPPAPFEGKITVNVREKEVDLVKTCKVAIGFAQKSTHDVSTCSDKTFVVSWLTQTITVWCLDLLRTFKTFHKGRRTACSKCEGTVNAESEVPGISKDLHHRPTIRTQTWQMGTVSCEDRGVRLIGLIFFSKQWSSSRLPPQCIDNSLLDDWRSKCLSRSNCAFKVIQGFVRMDRTCKGKMEMRTEHICGRNRILPHQSQILSHFHPNIFMKTWVPSSLIQIM